MLRKYILLCLVVAIVCLAGLDAWLLRANRELSKLLTEANDEVMVLRTAAVDRRVVGSSGRLALTAYNLGSDRKPGCAACSASPALTVAELDRRAAREIERLNHSAKRSIESVQSLSLQDLRTRYLPQDSSLRYALVVFFSPTDCPACLNEGAFWERLHEGKKALHIAVLGIADRTNDSELSAFIRQKRLTFPILRDDASLLRNLFGIDRTPYAVLLDEDGKVIMVDTTQPDPIAQRAFERKLTARLEHH
jgi:peroxiredoxin